MADSGSSNGGAADPRAGGDNAGAARTPSVWNNVSGLLKANVWETLLWVLRLAVVYYSIGYFLPIFGGGMMQSFQKALLANGATSALRLHQRLPNFQLSREFFARLLLEDSAHYLLYSLVFMNSQPITMVIIPVFLYSLLHVQNFTRQLLNAVSPTFGGPIRKLLSKLAESQVSILRFISLIEIFMMVTCVIMVFSGSAFFLLPFMYYRFLTLRYASQRNPYCRQLFYEIRVVVEQFAMNPRCPQLVRSIIMKAIAVVSSCAPAVAPR